MADQDVIWREDPQPLASLGHTLGTILYVWVILMVVML